MPRRIFTQADCDRLKRLRAAGHSLTVCGELMKRHRHVLGIVEARGYTPTPTFERPIPGDFAVQAAAMTIMELRRHYGACSSTITRWAREAKRQKMRVGRPNPDFIRPRPDDFADTHARLTWSQLLKHYRCGPSTARRWMRECGIAIRSPRKPQAQPAPGAWIDSYQPTPDYLALRRRLPDRRGAAL